MGFYSAARQNQSSNGSSVFFPKFLAAAKFNFVVCLPSSLPLRACSKDSIETGNFYR